MPIQAILFDAGGVLYHRPREDRHFEAFLNEHGLTMRHRQIVEKGLRAATFDVQSGRISRDVFYDALMRIHGLDDDALFPAGRTALLRDAADIELFPGVIETLHTLYEAGYKLGVVSDTAHPAADKINWLAARGLDPSLWDAFVVSSEVGQLKTGRPIFEQALAPMGVNWDEAAFVGHNTVELLNAADFGLVTIAFMPDDPSVETAYMISSFYGLQDLFIASE
jgi:FMN phosphatase YigB (HAD superfamily)